MKCQVVIAAIFTLFLSASGTQGGEVSEGIPGCGLAHFPILEDLFPAVGGLAFIDISKANYTVREAPPKKKCQSRTGGGAASGGGSSQHGSHKKNTATTPGPGSAGASGGGDKPPEMPWQIKALIDMLPDPLGYKLLILIFKMIKAWGQNPIGRAHLWAIPYQNDEFSQVFPILGGDTSVEQIESGIRQLTEGAQMHLVELLESNPLITSQSCPFPEWTLPGIKASFMPGDPFGMKPKK